MIFKKGGLSRLVENSMIPRSAFPERFQTSAEVVVSPGIGYDEYGGGCVSYASVEKEHRINQPIRGIRNIL